MFLAGCLQHGTYPFSAILERLQLDHSQNHAPLVQTVLAGGGHGTLVYERAFVHESEGKEDESDESGSESESDGSRRRWSSRCIEPT